MRGSLLRAAWVAAVAVLCLPACGGGGEQLGPGQPGGLCLPPRTPCGPRACVNLAQAEKHCGACGAACIGGELCMNSLCICPPTAPDCKGPAALAYQQGRMLYNQGKYKMAAAAFQAFLQMYPGDIRHDNAVFWLGRSFHEQGGPMLEQALMQYLMVPNLPVTGITLHEDALMYAGRVEYDMGERDRNMRLPSALQHYLQADMFFERLFAEFPNHNDGVIWTARYFYGMSAYRRDDFPTAVQRLQMAVALIPPQSKWEDNALYFLGRAFFKMGQFDQAIQHWAQYMVEHGHEMGAQHKDEAVFWTGRAYKDSGRCPMAIGSFQQLLGQFPQSRWRDNAHARIIDCQLMLGDCGGARAQLGSFQAEHPNAMMLNGARRAVNMRCP